MRTPSAIQDHKICTYCKQDKLKTDYRHNKGRGGDGLSSACKKCLAVKAREWEQKNREMYLAYNIEYNAKRKKVS